MNLTIIKKLIPKKILNLRHWWFAWFGAIKYHHPSRELWVIGITGTSGKSTTVFLLRQLLESAGYRVGSLSTIDFYIAGEDKLNDQKMTMLGKYAIQKYLREMVNKKCDIAIVETTSEGQLQYRNHYIAYDVMVLTNLYPEHIEAHGGFANYKQAKLNIFKRAAVYGKNKMIAAPLEKTFVINGDTAEAPEFLQTGVARKIIFGKNSVGMQNIKNVEKIILSEAGGTADGVRGVIDGQAITAPMYGEHNLLNITAAVAVCRALGIGWEKLKPAISRLENAPGRNEFIPEAEQYGFKVIVDYAFEPQAMTALHAVAALLNPKRVIQVFGSTGGGRDVSRRFSVGELAGKTADICIITDEDPYDDEPAIIMTDVANAVRRTGKKDNENLFIIPDRRAAINKALHLAQTGDLVLITGKGSEQAMIVAHGQKIPWDDRQVVREELTHL